MTRVGETSVPKYKTIVFYIFNLSLDILVHCSMWEMEVVVKLCLGICPTLK